MFQNKSTKKSIRAKLEKLENQLTRLKESWEVKTMLEFNILPPLVKMDIQADWDKYYEDCKKSEAHSLFIDIKNAAKNQDFVAVNLIRERVKELLEHPQLQQQPRFADPLSFSHGDCAEYKFILKRQEEMLAELSSFGDKNSSTMEDQVKSALF